MNDDETLEAWLRELALSANPDDPTPAWKEEILAVALRPPVSLAPPRPLLLTWAAAWIASLFLAWTSPPEPERTGPANALASATSVSSLFTHHRILEQLALP